MPDCLDTLALALFESIEPCKSLRMNALHMLEGFRPRMSIETDQPAAILAIYQRFPGERATRYSARVAPENNIWRVVAVVTVALTLPSDPCATTGVEALSGEIWQGFPKSTGALPGAHPLDLPHNYVDNSAHFVQLVLRWV